jgi:Nucleoside 2-deoxyribosyltransferase like
MSTYIEAPAEFDGDSPSLFFCGGITACLDWQMVLARQLADLPITILNPRRKNFPMGDPTAAADQIAWEHRHLRRASAILFWFPRETLCPITLYELGAWSMSRKPLFIGTHLDYQRCQDVEIQTRLARPEVSVVHALDDLVQQVREWCKTL